jgi:hypothetical protein
MRLLSVVTAFCIIPGLAFADASVAGYWRADLGDGVSIEMNLSPNGQWNSVTHRGSERLAELAGKYSQKVRSSDSGNLVFVPTKSYVTAEHGAAVVEHDRYILSRDGQEMTLDSAGDKLEFKKLSP